MKVSTALMLGIASGSASAAWESSVDQQGLRVAMTDGSAQFEDREVPARLRLQCRPGAEGAVLWELELRQSGELANFGFDDYEGPDARGLKERRTEIVPEGGLLRTVVKAAPAGFYTSADTFVLAVSAPANEASDIALLADLISPDTDTVVWTTPSLRGEGAPLTARFDATGATAELREAMMGCGPAPAFDPALFERAQGRNPASSNLWRERALEWRLKGLLGQDYETFATRMQSAQPLAREGDSVWYVLSSPTTDGNAAVVMFDATDAEVVLVENGVARLTATRPEKLQAPQAVRDFLAAHSGAR